MPYIFTTTLTNGEKYVEIMPPNSSDNCVYGYSTEILNQKQIKTIAKWVEKVQTILVLVYKKRNDRKIFHWSVKLIASDSDIDEAFISMHQSIMTRIKQYANEDWIVLDVIIKQSIKIFGC